MDSGIYYDLLTDESELGIAIMEACVLMRHGKSKQEALRACKMSEKQFDENYSKVFPGRTLEQLDEINRICREQNKKK